jgi:predicted ferric reductase
MTRSRERPFVDTKGSPAHASALLGEQTVPSIRQDQFPEHRGPLPSWQWAQSRAWGAILIVLYFVAAVWPFVFVRILNRGLRDSILVELGRAAALVGFSQMVLQVVLAGRFKRLDAPFGLDRLMQFHKAMAVLGGTLLLIHPILISLGLGSFALFTSETPWPIDLGKAALAFALVMIVFSTTFDLLAVDYNIWRFIHKSMILIVMLGFIHSTQVGTDLRETPMMVLWWVLLAIAGGIYLYRNAYVPIWGRRRFRVSDIRQETHDTYSVRFEPADDKPLPRNPGQFMFLRLVRPGRKSETHPFTISASPLEPQIVETTIKKSGNFTNTIDQTRVGDTGRIEGPFGRFSLVHDDIQQFVFIAGGVGITPIMSMLRYLRDTGDKRPVVLLYGNKTAGDIIFAQELESLPDHMRVVHVLSRPDSAWTGRTGHITRAIIDEFTGEHLKESHVFVCGPVPMINAVIRELREAGVDRRRIHYERFTI